MLWVQKYKGALSSFDKKKELTPPLQPGGLMAFISVPVCFLKATVGVYTKKGKFIKKKKKKGKDGSPDGKPGPKRGVRQNSGT